MAKKVPAADVYFGRRHDVLKGESRTYVLRPHDGLSIN